DGVVIGLEVAGDHGHALAGIEAREGFFQQRCLARAGRTDQVSAINAPCAKAGAQAAGDALIFAQHFGFDIHSCHAWFTTPSSSSSKNDSSSSVPVAGAVF